MVAQVLSCYAQWSGHYILDPKSITIAHAYLLFFRNKKMYSVIFNKIVVVTKVYKIAEFVCIVFYISGIIKSERLSTVEVVFRTKHFTVLLAQLLDGSVRKRNQRDS